MLYTYVAFVNITIPGFKKVQSVEFKTNEKIKLINWYKNEIIAKDEIIKKLLDPENAFIQRSITAKAINDLNEAYKDMKVREKIYNQIRITGFNIAS